MASVVQQALIFLVQFIFSLYSFLLALRVWMRAVHADYNHPFVTGVARLTTPLIKRLHFIGDIKNIELASLALLFVVIVIKLVLMSLLAGELPGLLGLIIGACGTLLNVGLDLIFYVMIFMALLGWMPQAQPALFVLVSQLTQPILQPVRKILPTLYGMDVSPLIVLLVAQLVKILVSDPLIRAGLNTTIN